MVAPVGPLITGRTVIDAIGDIYQYTPPTLTPSTPPPVPPLVVRRIATDTAGDVFEYTPPTLTQRSAPPPPTNTSPPQIVVVTGGGNVGSQLVRQNPGTWVPPGPYTNQWQSAGVNIPGATGVSYITQASDAGNAITLVVTVTNEGGSLSATSNSITLNPLPPHNTVPPVIVVAGGGGPIVGSIIQYSSYGTWVPDGTNSNQWLRNGTVVSTSQTSYTLQAADVGFMMTGHITRTNAGGSGSATSNALGPVTAT